MGKRKEKRLVVVKKKARNLPTHRAGSGNSPHVVGYRFQRARNGRLVAHQVNPEQARVLVRNVEGVEGVAQLPGGQGLGEGRGHFGAGPAEAVPGAEHRLHQHERVGVGVDPRGALEGHCHVARVHVGVGNLRACTGGAGV